MNLIGLALLSTTIVATQWQVERETDSFTDQERVTAHVAGEQSQAILQVQCSDGSLLVIFTTNGAALGSRSPQRADFMIRADDRPAVRLSGAGVRFNVAMSQSIHADFPALWEELRATKARFLFRVVSPTGKVIEDRFTAKDMQASLAEVASACT